MQTIKSMKNVSVTNCFVVVDDFDTALPFHCDVLGFSVHTDVTHESFRWLSVTTPTQPALQITLQSIAGYPGTSPDDETAMAELLAKGLLTGLIFDCDDVDAAFEHVRASGAEVLQEPMDQFYGVRDCAVRDPAGNMLRFKTDLAQQG